jgi:hypothetical protein
VIWTVARVLVIVIVLALVVLFSVALYAQSSDGTTQLLTDGAVIDGVALVILVASAWSLWRERRRT